MCNQENYRLFYLSSIAGHRSFYTYSAEPFHPLPGKTPAWKSPEEAVQVIQSGEGGPSIARCS